jgi:hypothetical protein
MWKIIYKPNCKFTVMAPDGELSIMANIRNLCFFRWQNECYMAVTPYFDGEVADGIYCLSDKRKHVEIDQTDGRN